MSARVADFRINPQKSEKNSPVKFSTVRIYPINTDFGGRGGKKMTIEVRAPGYPVSV